MSPENTSTDITKAPKASEGIRPARRAFLREAAALLGSGVVLSACATMPAHFVAEDHAENADNYGKSLDPLFEVPGDLVMTVVRLGETVWNPTGGEMWDLMNGNQQERKYLEPATESVGHFFDAAVHTTNGFFILTVAATNTVYLVVRDGGEILWDEIQLQREKNGWALISSDQQHIAFLDSLPQGSLPETADMDLQMQLGAHYAMVDTIGASELMQMKGDIDVPQDLVLSGELSEMTNKDGIQYVEFAHNPKVLLSSEGLVVRGERFDQKVSATVAHDFERESLFVDVDGSVVVRSANGYIIVDTEGNVIKMQGNEMYSYANDDLPYVHRSLVTAKK